MDWQVLQGLWPQRVLFRPDKMTRIEREKQIVRKMIELYCRHRLKEEAMPEEYILLAEYACRRLDH
jgi:hypothetical protein